MPKIVQPLDFTVEQWTIANVNGKYCNCISEDMEEVLMLDIGVYYKRDEPIEMYCKREDMPFASDPKRPHIFGVEEVANGHCVWVKVSLPNGYYDPRGYTLVRDALMQLISSVINNRRLWRR